jgi:hypothetical protein
MGKNPKKSGAAHDEPPQHYKGVYESKAPGVPKLYIGNLYRWFRIDFKMLFDNLLSSGA